MALELNSIKMAGGTESNRTYIIDVENPFAKLDLQQAIELRWTLRDIKAKRWVLSLSILLICKH
jgi:hypothetical protein